MADDVFEQAFQDAPIGMALVALDGRWLRVNDALCSLVGYTAEELKQINFQALTHRADLQKSLGVRLALLSGHSRRVVEPKRYLHKTGRILHVEIHVSLVRDPHGLPQFFITQIHDKSDIRRAESERDMFFSMATDLLAIAAGTGDLLEVNPAWKTFLGVNEERLLGRGFVEYLHPDDKGDPKRAVAMLMEPGARLRNRWMTTSGAYRYVEWTAGGKRDGCLYLVGRPIEGSTAPPT